MIKGLALISVLLALLATQASSTTDWDNWNTYTSTHYSQVHAISIPSVPADFTRHTDSSNSSYGSRKNQYKYRYDYVVSGTECNFYCGPRSFLVIESGRYLCARDTSSQFWGGKSGFGSHCIPDVDSTLACNAVDSSMASVGFCNKAEYNYDTFYVNYECCYDNNNSVDPKNDELNDNTVTTSYYYLRNAE